VLQKTSARVSSPVTRSNSANDSRSAAGVSADPNASDVGSANIAS
jgi:hypothetical protein